MSFQKQLHSSLFVGSSSLIGTGDVRGSVAEHSYTLAALVTPRARSPTCPGYTWSIFPSGCSFHRNPSESRNLNPFHKGQFTLNQIRYTIGRCTYPVTSKLQGVTVWERTRVTSPLWGELLLLLQDQSYMVGNGNYVKVSGPESIISISQASFPISLTSFIPSCLLFDCALPTSLFLPRGCFSTPQGQLRSV